MLIVTFVSTLVLGIEQGIGIVKEIGILRRMQIAHLHDVTRCQLIKMRFDDSALRNACFILGTGAS